MKEEEEFKTCFTQEVLNDMLTRVGKFYRLNDAIEDFKDVYNEMGQPENMEGLIEMVDAYYETRYVDLSDEDKKFIFDLISVKRGEGIFKKINKKDPNYKSHKILIEQVRELNFSTKKRRRN